MSLIEMFSIQERKRREYQFLSPNLIWFQRHETRPSVVAEVCRVSNRLRWRVFDGTSNEPCAEGVTKTVPGAMKQVFDYWKNAVFAVALLSLSACASIQRAPAEYESVSTDYLIKEVPR